MTIFCLTPKTKIKNLMLRPTQIKNNSCITPLYKHGKKENMWDASGGGLGCKATATLEAPRRLARVQGDSHTGSSPGGGLGPATELHFTRMHSSHPTPANRQVTWMKKFSLLVASLTLLGREHHPRPWLLRLILGECSGCQQIFNLLDGFSGIRMTVMTSTPDLAHQDVVLCHPDGPFPQHRIRLRRRTVMRDASAECLRRVSRRLGPTRSTPGGGLGIGATSLRNPWFDH